MRALIDDPRRRRALGARARERALAYTPARMAGGYLEAYAELAARRPARGGEAVACAS